MNEFSVDVDEHDVPEEASEYVTLPIGFEKDGNRYRNVVIDELSGIDEALVSNKKKTGGNVAKGLTYVLARSIQEIEGLIPRKKNSDSLIDHVLVRNLYQADRDFLFSRIQMLTGNDRTMLRAQCPRCENLYEREILLSKQPVENWPEDKKCTISFELSRGYRDGKELHKKGVLRFPRGSDQEAVAVMAQNNGAAAITAMIAATVISLGTMEGIDQHIASKLKSRDRRAILNAVRDNIPGMKMWEYVTCYNCGNDKLEAKVDISSFFG
jgi:hypothetical protein